MKHLKKIESFLINEHMLLKIQNENDGKIYSKTINNKSVQDFYDIDDDISESFEEYMEKKYKVTMDFTGTRDSIAFTIYELDDDEVFEKILDDYYNFILDPNLWHDTNKYNL